MKMKREVIYVVRGSTGEYSDLTDWPIVAVRAEKTAEKLVTKLDVLALENGISVNNCASLTRVQREAAVVRVNVVVPGAVESVDYTGVRFYYETVPVKRMRTRVRKGARMMKLERLDTKLFPPNGAEARAVELRNSRKAVRRLRFFLRWTLSELNGATANDPAARNAYHLLAATTPRKLKGK